MSTIARTSRVPLTIAAWLLAPLSLIANRPTVAQTLTEHPYIDPAEIKSETCLGCHQDKEEGKFIHSAVDVGCESCHQASSEKEKEKTAITLLATGGELCAMCHEAKQDPVVHGPYKAGECLVCHNPHSSNFPRQTRAATNSLCMSCHAAGQPNVRVNAESKKISLLDGRTFDLDSYQKAPKIGTEHSGSSTPPTVSHPVTGRDPRKPDAELSCISCHDPHASKAENLLRKATESRNAAENLCLSCHIDINAQVQKSVQHAAVDMGCGTCHSPHKGEPAGSPQGTFYLTSAQPDLCLACHEATDSAIQKAHLGQPFATSRCSECHNPHGSESAKLINNFAHPPFADKSCDTCHGEPKEGKIVLNEGAQRDLCLMCHADMQEQISEAKVVHAALQKDTGCVSCHTPHAATYPHQVRRRTVDTCLGCHTEQARVWKGKQYLHRPVFEISCAICHEPHTGESQRRLRAAKVNDLCLACHGSQVRIALQAGGQLELFGGTVKVDAAGLAGMRLLPIRLGDKKGHPYARHPVADDASLTCLTCHNPHAADGSERRFVTESASSAPLCLTCHK